MNRLKLKKQPHKLLCKLIGALLVTVLLVPAMHLSKISACTNNKHSHAELREDGWYYCGIGSDTYEKITREELLQNFEKESEEHIPMHHCITILTDPSAEDVTLITNTPDLYELSFAGESAYEASITTENKPWTVYVEAPKASISLTMDNPTQGFLDCYVYAAASFSLTCDSLSELYVASKTDDSGSLTSLGEEHC